MEGFNQELLYNGPHERVNKTSVQDLYATVFAEIILMQISYGNIPDGFPFDEGGSELLIEGGELDYPDDADDEDEMDTPLREI